MVDYSRIEVDKEYRFKDSYYLDLKVKVVDKKFDNDKYYTFRLKVLDKYNGLQSKYYEVNDTFVITVSSEKVQDHMLNAQFKEIKE